jgi:hypothetical protein
MLQAKMLRLELLNVKADLERSLGDLVLHCTACGLEVHGSPVSQAGLAIGRIANQRRMANPLCATDNCALTSLIIR